MLTPRAMLDQGTPDEGAPQMHETAEESGDIVVAASSGSTTTHRNPTLRRISGAENMSVLRAVNASARIKTQDQTPERDTFCSPVHIDLQQGVGAQKSSLVSPAPGSVFSIAEEPRDEMLTEATTMYDGADAYGLGPEEEDSYDLKPPRTRLHGNNLEVLSDRFFSADHLDLILKDYALAARFKAFLKTHLPEHVATLERYTAARKAIQAVEYANAVANRIQPWPGHPPLVAANIDERFSVQAKEIAQDVVQEALPAYLTHRLVTLVTDTLVKEITGNSAPIMHDLIPSLAEVYCISEPSTKDNPIVYASQEFFNLTQYSKEYTIGRNCRFLQGERTSEASVKRLIHCLSKGEECCETILNYTRSGEPFMNLLMIAPLYDNKGAVRYFLGCQIDVSSLIEDGRGVQSFAQLLADDRHQASQRASTVHHDTTRDPSTILGDLGQLLTEEESEIVRNRATDSTAILRHGADRGSITSTARGSPLSRQGTKNGRIILGMEASEKPLWPAMELGRSGRLPGVYQNYLLVRPFPSLRITFTSPSLRIPGLLQAKLLDRVGGPAAVREGLQDALSRGTGVTAKVTWLTSNANAEFETGRTRWLHCTPLIGADERVGVWMIVVCHEESSNGSLMRDDSRSSTRNSQGAAVFTSQKLYADYLKREGREDRPSTGSTIGTSADQFREF